MFYSHNFLARKSPLGTVWIAAHLQNRLRKPQVAGTDIVSSVDCIMFPEVPIALRLSGHLLLGVVRIYSKKVDYLYQDCNDARTRIMNVFSSMQDVNLPENASHAPFHAITLPETFELDALDLNDELYFGGSQDDHLRNHEDITIPDQIPCGEDPYHAFFINEDIIMDVSPLPEILETEAGAGAMEEDMPSVQAENGVDVSVPVPSNHVDEHTQKLSEDPSNQVIPEPEVIRDSVHDFGSENLPDWMDLDNNTIEQHKPVEESMNERENLSPIMEEGSQIVPFQLHTDPPTVVASATSPENFHSNSSLGHDLPEMAIAPTPVEKKKAKTRKRKQFFDSSVVLSNEFIKEALNNASKLVHKRKKLPCSALDICKLSNRSRKDQVFSGPSISGMNINLQNLFKKDAIPSKFCISQTADHIPEPEPDQMPEPDLASQPDPIPGPGPMPEPSTEIEHLRFDEGHVENSSFPELMPSPSRGDEVTPVAHSNLVSEPQTEVLPTLETDLGSEFERTASSFGFEMETPVTQLDEHLDIENTGLSDIPELRDSAEVEELSFLEADNTPDGYKENEESNALSVRTRAVAQYLQKQSPNTEISNEQVGNLSLDKILEGKTRRKCARMFYETLVLKSFDLIDVLQEEAYGDITVSLTSKLMKFKF